MFAAYEKDLLAQLEKPLSPVDRRRLLKIHREKLSFLQHERLIHLLVTLAIALFTVLLFLATILTGSCFFLLPDLLLGCLLVAYLFHYRKLENTTQRWYGLVDRLNDK